MPVSQFDWSSHVSGGTQPVSVLQNNIIHELEKVTPHFAHEVKELIRSAGLKPGFTFNCESQPIVAPDEAGKLNTRAASVDADNRVQFYETFLSYVWCISYSLIVLYEEANAKPARGIVGSLLDIERAQNLLRYGLNLISGFRPWDTSLLPNPQHYGPHDKLYTEKANGVFCFAAIFVILHEIGHVEKGHTKTLGTYVPTFDLIWQEIEADKFAIQKIAEGLEGQMDFNKNCGVVVGLVSLLLLSRSLLGKEHPDNDDRLRDGLINLKLDEKSPVWLVALLGIRIWEQTYHRPIIWPVDVLTPKSYFLKTVEAIKAFK